MLVVELGVVEVVEIVELVGLVELVLKMTDVEDLLLVVELVKIEEELEKEDSLYRSKKPDPPQNWDELPAQTILQLEILAEAPPLEIVLPQSSWQKIH